MKTYVTLSDYNALKKCMTEEEIKEKYGRLIVMSEEEHKDYLKKIKKKGDVYENNSISKQHH